MNQILIVDEEEHLLWALENNLLPDRDDIKIITAKSGEVGLDLLRDENIDVLICDIKMPGRVDGFQLILRAKEVAPDARVVIMTAFGTNRIQNLAERVGITHYIEKPFNISDLRNVILELLDADQGEGFQGVLSDLELTDIIQMLCLARRTALLHLKHREHRGRIVFERGDVTHAEFDEIEGESAVYQMLALKQGDIYMQSDFQNDQRTINVGWQDLLLEGVRRADEHRAMLGLEESSAGAEGAAAGPFGGVFEDSGEITLGMPPRLVPEVDGSSEGLAEETSAPSFFTEEELEEIENAGRDLTGTANGFDRILDSGVRDLIEQHDRRGQEDATTSAPASASTAESIIPGNVTDSAAEEDTEVESSAVSGESTEPRGFDDISSPAPGLESPSVAAEHPAHPPGRPTDSANYPRQTPSARDSSGPGFGAPAPSSGRVDAPPAAAAASSSTASGRPATPPSAVAEEVQAPRMSSGAWATPGAAPGLSSQAMNALDHRAAAPTMMLEAPGILSSRSILQEFANELKELVTTGLFSFDDGLSLDFVSTPGAYEEDVLSAFFRDVAASAQQTCRALMGEGGFVELQIALEREIILLRRIDDTPYVHIAVMTREVRLGIAIVLMRRYGQRLTQCFNH